MVGLKVTILDVDGYVDRAGRSVPKAADGSRDDARIRAAISDACGEVVAELSVELVTDDGELVDSAPRRLRKVLPGIVFAIARLRATDGATGAENPIMRDAEAARALLRRLAKGPQDRGPKEEVKASVVTGTSRWSQRRGVS